MFCSSLYFPSPLLELDAGLVARQPRLNFVLEENNGIDYLHLILPGGICLRLRYTHIYIHLDKSRLCGFPQSPRSFLGWNLALSSRDQTGKLTNSHMRRSFICKDVPLCWSVQSDKSTLAQQKKSLRFFRQHWLVSTVRYIQTYLPGMYTCMRGDEQIFNVYATMMRHSVIVLARSMQRSVFTHVRLCDLQKTSTRQCM